MDEQSVMPKWDDEARARLRALQAKEPGVFVPLAGFGVPAGRYALQLLFSQWFVWESDDNVPGTWVFYSRVFVRADDAARSAADIYRARIAPAQEATDERG